MYRLVVKQVLLLVLLVALLVFMLSACGGSEESKPRPLPEARQDLPPGEYRSEEFEPSLSFRVGEGWTNFPPEVYDGLRITRGYEIGGLGFANLQGARFYRPTRTGTPYVVEVPEDMVGWFRRHPYLKTDGPEPVEVGEVKGVQLDVAVEDLPNDHSGMCGSDCVGFFRLSSGGPPLAFWEEDKARVISFEDVKGERVIVGFGSPSTEFDEHAKEAQKVIDTVKWRAPQKREAV